jgi:CheY-like chemotaxis protein
MPSGKTILICEDNAVVLEESARVLSEAGFKVFQAKDAENTIQLSKNFSVDLILLDIVLGNGMTGLECYEEIQRLNKNILIVLTSFAAPPAWFCKHHPEHKFLEKSHALSKLPEKLLEILNQSYSTSS